MHRREYSGGKKKKSVFSTTTRQSRDKLQALGGVNLYNDSKMAKELNPMKEQPSSYFYLQVRKQGNSKHLR